MAEEFAEAMTGATSGQEVVPSHRSALPSQEVLLQALLAPSPLEGKMKEPPRWMWFMPGFGKGVAMRQQMDAQQEDLKLRRQQLAGQQAVQKLQMLQLQQRIEGQQKLKRWAGLYQGLVEHGEVLDPQAEQELEGQMVRELAEAGDPEKVEKFIASRRSQKALRAMDALDRQDAGGVPASPAGAAGPALGSVPPGAPGKDAYAQDQLKLARLRQEAVTLEQTLRGYARLNVGEAGKARIDVGKTRLADLRENIQQLETRLTPGTSEVERIARKPKAYLTPEDLGQADTTITQRDLEKAQRSQEVGLSNAGQKAYDAAIAKNEAELENAPLGEAMAERVSSLNTIIEFANEVARLRQNGFTGQIVGRAGALREFTGDISKDEVQFRQLLLDAKDLLSRARSGAAIPESEHERLSRLLPSVTDPPNVFVAKLERFGKSVEELRDAKVKLAITPRGQLLQTMPRITKPDTSKRLTTADIDTTWQAKNKERTATGLPPLSRQQLVDALKAQGYEVP